MNPKYPVYVISKGRWERPLTVRAFEKIKVPFNLIIEPQEFSQYANVIDRSKILTLPFSDLGEGSIPARNWVLDHAKQQNHHRHWIVDDNISEFYRLHQNIKYRVTSGTIFRAMEDFVDRYENIPIAGPNYEMFVQRRSPCPPVTFNTRIYSCILFGTQTKFRWRGRYNEDTDLSLRILKAGFCSVLFNAFLANKAATMTMKGGNTDELYRLEGGKDGRWLMAESLCKQHPDVAKTTRKWGRWQHQVNYKPFRRNKLLKKKGVHIPKKENNYGMTLRAKQ